MSTNNKWGDVKFLHYRSFDSEGNVSDKGGATIAYVLLDDGTIRWATAKCNSEDRYVKNYGRTKAAGRLLSRRLACAGTLSLPEFIAEMDEVAEWSGFYRRTRKLI